jgi:hypothetical protein
MVELHTTRQLVANHAMLRRVVCEKNSKACDELPYGL